MFFSGNTVPRKCRDLLQTTTMNPVSRDIIYKLLLYMIFQISLAGHSYSTCVGFPYAPEKQRADYSHRFKLSLLYCGTFRIWHGICSLRGEQKELERYGGG